MLKTIINGIVAFFSIIDRLAQRYHDNQIRKAERIEIENEARKDARETNNQLRDALDKPVDVDSLPNSFFQSTESDAESSTK